MQNMAGEVQQSLTYPYIVKVFGLMCWQQCSYKKPMRSITIYRFGFGSFPTVHCINARLLIVRSSKHSCSALRKKWWNVVSECYMETNTNADDLTHFSVQVVFLLVLPSNVLQNSPQTLLNFRVIALIAPLLQKKLGVSLGQVIQTKNLYLLHSGCSGTCEPSSCPEGNGIPLSGKNFNCCIRLTLT